MKAELNKIFEMKDLGEAAKCIGLEINRNLLSRNVSISQSSYAEFILKHFGMLDCNSVSTPMEQGFHPEVSTRPYCDVPYRQLIGSLMFLMVGSRPDLAYVVGNLSQHCEDPRQDHRLAGKRVLRCIRGTISTGVVLNGRTSVDILEGFSDADWSGCLNSRKSTIGYVFKLCGGTVSWSSRKQTLVAKSACEAEYVAICEA